MGIVRECTMVRYRHVCTHFRIPKRNCFADAGGLEASILFHSHYNTLQDRLWKSMAWYGMAKGQFNGIISSAKVDDVLVLESRVSKHDHSKYLGKYRFTKLRYLAIGYQAHQSAPLRHFPFPFPPHSIYCSESPNRTSHDRDRCILMSSLSPRHIDESGCAKLLLRCR